MRVGSVRHHHGRVRGPDRRRSEVAFRVPERRDGFDRRRPPRGSWRRRFDRFLRRYRDDPGLIIEVLGVFLLLNLADLVLTLDALSLGAVEANPFMAGLFDLSPVVASLFKLTVGLLIAGILWKMRRYRRALEASLVLVGVMTLVLLYHGWLLVA